MLEKFLKPYRGLSKEIWILAFMTLVNRAGAMVIPFLSLYLTKSLGFSMVQVGWIMTSFGVGSLIGTWIGGKLTDKIGYHKIMYLSLFFTGLLFFMLQFLETFWQFTVGIFVLTFVADMFRPAIWVAMSDYSTEENNTRSVTLIRLAINLGFSAGPALGGLIIATIGYKGLFWIDGITTIIASVIVYKMLIQKSNANKKESKKDSKNKLPYFDFQFVLFWIALVLGGFAFVQYFYTMPLFYSEVIHLDEQAIGYILALNGLLIFLIEMPIVDHFVKKKTLHINLMIYGTILFAMSFFVLNMSHSLIVIVLAMVFLTVGEILNFPFSNTYAMERSKRGNQGEYMAFYVITFSVSNILGPNIGLQLVSKYGYDFLWNFSTGVLLLSCLMFLWLKKNYTKNSMKKIKK